MTPPPKPTRRFAPSAAMGGRRVLLPYLVSLVVIALLSLAAILFFGRVRGVELAPNHFLMREFSYWEIPLLKLQVSPVDRTSITPPLVNQLATGNPALLNPTRVAHSDWDLVSVTRGSSTRPADAKLLADFLQGTTQPPSPASYHYGSASFNSPWALWTTAQPQHAAELWPRVQTLAGRGQYLLIPDLFRLAEQATTADPPATAGQLAERLDGFLGDSYQKMIADFQAAGEPAAAESLQQTAQQDFPGDPRFASQP